MNKQKIAFKATHKELKDSSSSGCIIYQNDELILIRTEYLNPLRREGHANISIQVDNKKHHRSFETRVSDIYLMNFISKFVNKADYREQYFIGLIGS